ncbi:MAG: hypothetical protein KKA90_04290 [Nanoarchaeota archaeon]|nr:hypothetical protein [Nanoarchaeota archaeon]
MLSEDDLDPRILRYRDEIISLYETPPIGALDPRIGYIEPDFLSQRYTTLDEDEQRLFRSAIGLLLREPPEHPHMTNDLLWLTEYHAMTELLDVVATALDTAGYPVTRVRLTSVRDYLAKVARRVSSESTGAGDT